MSMMELFLVKLGSKYLISRKRTLVRGGRFVRPDTIPNRPFR